MASKVILFVSSLVLAFKTVSAANMACVNLKDSFMAKGVDDGDLIRAPVKGKRFRILSPVSFRILERDFFSSDAKA